MVRFARALVLVGLVPSFLAGCGSAEGAPEVETGSLASAGTVQRTGTATLEHNGARTLQQYSFFLRDGVRGRRIGIDLGTERGCFSGIGHSVHPLDAARVIVRKEALAVPAVVCDPSMERDLPVGIEVDVPDDTSFFQIYLDDQFGGAARVTGAAIETTIGPSPLTFDTYTYQDSTGAPVVMDVGRETIRGCFAGLGYSVTQDTFSNYVTVDALAVPAVVCDPSMERDIELGRTVTSMSQFGSTFGVLTVQRLAADQPTKVVLRGARNNPVQPSTKTFRVSVAPGSNEEINTLRRMNVFFKILNQLDVRCDDGPALTLVCKTSRPVSEADFARVSPLVLSVTEL